MADKIVTGAFGGIKYHDNGDGTYSEQIFIQEDGAGATLGSGRTVVPTAGTAVPLNTTTSISEVVVTAEQDNTGIVVVGGADVIAVLATRKGTPLAAGDSISFDIDDLAKVYIDATVNGEGVTYTYAT